MVKEKFWFKNKHYEFKINWSGGIWLLLLHVGWV